MSKNNEVDQLNDNQENFRIIVEHSSIVFYRHDVNHVLNYISPQCKQVFGYSEKEMMVKWTELCTDNPMNEEGFKLTEKAIKTGKKQQKYLLEFNRKDKQKFIAEIDESPLKDSNGKVVEIIGACTDVTEKINVEKALKEKEEKFKTLFFNSPDLVALTDLDGKFLDLNRGSHGFSKEQVIGTYVKDWVQESEYDKYAKAVKDAIETGKPQSYEPVQELPDGSIVHWFNKVSPLKLDENRSYLIFTFTDVSEKIKVEKQLKESENHYRTLFENAPLMLGHIDGDGNYLDINNRVESMFGYSESLFKGENVFSFIHKDDQAKVAEAFTTVKKTGSAEVTYRFRHKNGNYLLLKSRGTKIQETDTYFIYSDDITKQKQSEEELQAANQQLQASEQQLRASNQQLTTSEQQLNASNQQLRANEQQLRAANQQLQASEQELRAAKELSEKKEKYYHTVLNKMGDPVFVKDDKSRLLLVNDAFCELFGLERSDILGKTLAEDVAPEERENFLKIDKEVISTGKENLSEETLTLRGGQTRMISTKKTRFTDSNGNRFLIGTIRDITERKQSEEELQAANQQLQANEQQLRASNQQLAASEQQLKATNQQLIAESDKLGSTLDRYRLAQRIGHVGNWEYYLETDRFWGSEEAKRIYGFDPDAEDFTTEEVENCITERKRVHQALIDLIENDTPYDLEFEIISKDTGESKIIHSQAEIEKDENGNPLKVTGVIHDITERKQAEMELLKLKDNLELQVDEKTKELKEKISDLQRFHDATVEREFRIRELWEENEKLRKELEKKGI